MASSWIERIRRTPRRSGSGRTAAAALAALLAVAAPRPAAAQGEELRGRCTQEADTPGCLAVAQALAVAPPALILAAAAGSPVPGTANTLGIRLGDLPRWSFALRLTGARVGGLPRLESTEDAEKVTILAGAADVSLGLYPGTSLAPTVSGVAALDFLGSLGLVSPPGDAGFEGGVAFAWGAGLRLGLLRESFRVPGVSLSAMYRDLAEVAFEGRLGEWRSTSEALSFRAGVSKDLLGFATTLGAGLDRVSSDVEWRDGSILGGEGQGERALDDLVDTRFNVSGGIAWALIVLHGSLEVGWQQGAEVVPEAPAALRDVAESGNWFASLALRLSL